MLVLAPTIYAGVEPDKTDRCAQLFKEQVTISTCKSILRSSTDQISDSELQEKISRMVYGKSFVESEAEISRREVMLNAKDQSEGKREAERQCNRLYLAAEELKICRNLTMLSMSVRSDSQMVAEVTRQQEAILIENRELEKLSSEKFALEQADWLAAFAKKNSGKFKSEITELPKRVVIRTKPTGGSETYDQDRQVVKISREETGSHQMVYERCNPTGTYVGSNAFGTKIVVKQANCDRLVVEDQTSGGIEMWNLEFPMTPQQYRDFKSKGRIYEIEFEVGKGAKQEIAEVVNSISRATIDNPSERRIRTLTVYGQFEILRVLTPDGKMILAAAANGNRMSHAEQRMKEYIWRMTGLADASGAPSATGSALRSSGYSASYAGRIITRVKPNIVFTEDISNNPSAEVEVRTASDGTIVTRRLLQSSGNKGWDEAVLKALDKTEVLPRDIDGRVPSALIINFRARD